jgi:hypothetical protein
MFFLKNDEKRMKGSDAGKMRVLVVAYQDRKAKMGIELRQEEVARLPLPAKLAQQE